MTIQIFGTRGCQETRKAERFFKERRTDHHFVDLKKRAMSKGELRRFAQKYGAEALLDRESKRFRNRGLHAAHLTEAKILALLEEDPTLLRTPLVRIGQKVTLGVAEDDWAAWLES